MYLSNVVGVEQNDDHIHLRAIKISVSLRRQLEVGDKALWTLDCCPALFLGRLLSISYTVRSYCLCHWSCESVLWHVISYDSSKHSLFSTGSSLYGSISALLFALHDLSGNEYGLLRGTYSPQWYLGSAASR